MVCVKRWKTWVTGLAAVVLCVVSGCLRLYYPSVSVVAPPSICELPADVHVFRVDTCHDGKTMMPFVDREILTEISPADLWKPQVQFALNHHEYWLPNVDVIGFPDDKSITICIRLYRPGWKSVELASWDLIPTVKWEKAESLSDQEKALDKLVCSSELSVSQGSTSPAHRAALLFIVGEWERLGRDFANSELDQEVQLRLAEKTNKLRRLAEE